jgi:hypothetical protein
LLQREFLKIATIFDFFDLVLLVWTAELFPRMGRPNDFAPVPLPLEEETLLVI